MGDGEVGGLTLLVCSFNKRDHSMIASTHCKQGYVVRVLLLLKASREVSALADRIMMFTLKIKLVLFPET